MKRPYGKPAAVRTGYTEKLSELQQLKISPSLQKALIHIAKARGQEKTAAMREALATWVIDQGGYLPPECPENPARSWPEGSANHATSKLIQEALPRLKEALGDYAYERAVPRTQTLIQEILELNFKPLLNYAVEKFLDTSLTPTQQVHYVEERLKAVRDALHAAREA